MFSELVTELWVRHEHDEERRVPPESCVDRACDRNMEPMQPSVTPDGRYFVVRGRLWRCSNLALSEAERQHLTKQLMRARVAVGHALRRGDRRAEQQARAQVHEAKLALGERGPVWWRDGSPDYNRHLVKNTPYQQWFESLAATVVG